MHNLIFFFLKRKLFLLENAPSNWWCCVQVNDVYLADSCKITPAKFSGSKEVVPLQFRKQVSLACFSVSLLD